MKRYDEGVQAAKQMFDKVAGDGSLGPLLYARAHCYVGNSYCNAGGHVVTEEKAPYGDAGWPIAPDWLPEDWQKPYAVYLNTYSHNSNLLRYLFGRDAPGWNMPASMPNDGHIAVLELRQLHRHPGNRPYFQSRLGRSHRVLLRRRAVDAPHAPGAVEERAGQRRTLQGRRDAGSRLAANQLDVVDSAARPRHSLRPCSTATPLSITGAEALEELRLVEQIWRTAMSSRTSRQCRPGN